MGTASSLDRSMVIRIIMCDVVSSKGDFVMFKASKNRPSGFTSCLTKAALAAFFTATMSGWPAMASQDVPSVETDALANGFATPPDSARPRVWWHWLNGNITKDGIAKDLQWMKRIGIGGVQNFDATLITPQIVPQRLAYMTPEWKDAFRFAVNTADQLGLEFAIAASPGWSETGGPWVKPENGMKKLVWAQTEVSGGKRVSVRLPAPPSATGSFQDLKADPGTLARITGSKEFIPPTYYADAAVFAYPAPDASKLPIPRVTSNGNAVDPTPLLDDSLETGIQINRGTVEKPVLVTVEYDRPQTVRSATVFVSDAVSILSTSHFSTRIEAKVGPDEWKPVSDVVLTGVPTTVSFPPVTASSFRFVLAEMPGGGLPFKPAAGVDISIFAKILATKSTLQLTELKFSTEARVHQFEAKAGFSLLPDYYAVDGGVGPDLSGVAPDQVIDLTSRMKADGTLDWSAPKGKWRVVRLGYSLTGKSNHPATFEATGLEVDKYDGAAVREYMEHYLGMYSEAVGADLMGAHGLKALVTDSVEVGPSNWTPGILARFKQLRGYDARPFLPALTGIIVGSRRRSDEFLYDYRRTLGELFASEHYGTVAKVAHEHGLKVYGESLEGERAALGDDMQLRKYADYPMAALWTFERDKGPKPAYIADMKAAASVAHMYGKDAVAAESMTSALAPWANAPGDLRRIVDLEFAYGVNRPVIHTSVHQPVDDKVPGLSLMIFGQYFTRHETWAEMARPWIDYISRNSFLLQQGHNVADVAYFSGEEAPITKIFSDVPVQYAYDFVNADAILSLMQVDQGELVTPGGARYRVLYLGGSSSMMTLPVLRRLYELVSAGATVIGHAPKGSPSLRENGEEYGVLVKKLWAGGESNQVGKGRVIISDNVESALSGLGMAPDFSYTKPQADSEVLFVHRRLDDGDIYFVNNRRNRAETIEASFRVTGRKPEIWHADTGVIEAASYKADKERITVTLDLPHDGSFFVVFRKPLLKDELTIQKPNYVPVATMEGAWDVTFQAGRGAPDRIKLPSLGSLADQADPAVKYFSGVATYQKRFSLPKGIEPGGKLLLDLGAVGDIAEVRVNGQFVGTAWHPPFVIDIGNAIHKGSNKVEIKVADLWVNRLIGDAQPNAHKITFTALPTYRADAPLRPSGLIGPVRLLAQEHQ